LESLKIKVQTREKREMMNRIRQRGNPARTAETTHFVPDGTKKRFDRHFYQQIVPNGTTDGRVKMSRRDGMLVENEKKCFTSLIPSPNRTTDGRVKMSRRDKMSVEHTYTPRYRPVRDGMLVENEKN
jgi:hypothetical protein